MQLNLKCLILAVFLISSCDTGKLTVVGDLPSSLKETSALEHTPNSDLFWVIEDHGNKNNLYGLNAKGHIVKDIDIENSENEDWEDLTSDAEGNIYIGDFGNNNKNREKFTIYKVPQPDKAKDIITAQSIHFELPNEMKSEDLEAFFLYNDAFYIFSKDHKKCELIKVPNQIGNHKATYIAEIQLKGKHNQVTSADISDDGKTVVLLNHDKLWKLTGYTSDNFFSGSVEPLLFEHDSQKEGIVFTSENQVYITDEKKKHEGGNMYRFQIK